ncbi:MAG: hypothetical protein AABX59_04085 [Nanoarchaeota archaeon]|mgnify:FL=1
MNKKQIGIGLIIAAIVLFFITLSFTLEVNALNKMLHKDCPLPSDVCPFNKTVPSQSVVGFTFVALLLAFGIYLAFFSKEIASGMNKKELQIALKELKGDEKKILELVAEEGAVFQSALVEKSGISKVKVTRILDTL